MGPSTYTSKTAADRRPPQAKAAKKKGPNTPRLNPYSRLINRFYEPLLLLRVLGQTRGKHTAVPKSADPSQQSRRRLQENLAYLCDYGKGGPTTVALGLEGLETSYVFWIASNGAAKLDKMEPFLVSVIENLRRLIKNAPDFTEAEFIEQCIKFATPRIKKEQDLLKKFIASTIKSFPEPRSDTNQALTQWLQRFLDKSPIDLCHLSYDQRKSESMRIIAFRGRPAEDESDQSPLVKMYIGLRHLLGRLANHVRAPKLVIADASRHRNIFDEGVSTVKRVGPVDSVPRPEPDGLTTPAKILKRMVRDDHPKMKVYQDALDFMDQRLEIGRQIVESYENKDFHPGVHCEVQVLEHFYEHNLRFAMNDRFVACSKPACYCCSLYFQAHPADPEQPRSHQKIWPNWGPPLLPNGDRDEARYKHQRDILNKMVESIRKEALSQIERKVTDMGGHPDSTTGITPSLFSDRPLDERMASLHMASPRTNDEMDDDSDSSDSVQSMSSSSARSPHETSATDTDPEEGEEQGPWESNADRDVVVTDDAAVESSDDEEDPEAEGGAAL